MDDNGYLQNLGDFDLFHMTCRDFAAASMLVFFCITPMGFPLLFWYVLWRLNPLQFCAQENHLMNPLVKALFSSVETSGSRCGQPTINNCRGGRGWLISPMHWFWAWWILKALPHSYPQKHLWFLLGSLEFHTTYSFSFWHLSPKFSINLGSKKLWRQTAGGELDHVEFRWRQFCDPFASSL